MDAPSATTSKGRRKVKLVGYVGAGSEAHYYGNGDSPDVWLEAPASSTSDTVAVKVRGGFLGPGFKHWIVFYDEVRNPPTVDMFRKLCVVGLTDDRVLVKWLHPGSEQGRFHLVSNTEGMIENVEVKWAALVRGCRRNSRAARQGPSRLA